jgi:hypothetical protein
MIGKHNIGGNVRQTPIRRALNAGSDLLPQVVNGIQALEQKHRGYIHNDLRPGFSDSLEIDDNLKAGREQENRWDYLLGWALTGAIVGLEPHSAKTDQVSKVVKKRQMAIEQLDEHLKPGIKVSKWFWVASGTVYFANTDKERRTLDQNGIQFVGTKLMEKHLDKH